MRIKEILKITNGKLISGDPDRDIDLASISSDSRTIERGAFFLPIRGENFDGEKFVSEALKKGAIGTFVVRDSSYESRNPNDERRKNHYSGQGYDEGASADSPRAQDEVRHSRDRYHGKQRQDYDKGHDIRGALLEVQRIEERGDKEQPFRGAADAFKIEQEAQDVRLGNGHEP